MQLTLELSRELTSETGRLHVFDLADQPFTLGRSDQAAWTVIDETRSISRTHFELRREGDALVLTDLSSAGTALDSPENMLQPRTPTVLAGDAVIYLPVGSVRLTVEGVTTNIDALDADDEGDIFGSRLSSEERRRDSGWHEDGDPGENEAPSEPLSLFTDISAMRGLDGEKVPSNQAEKDWLSEAEGNLGKDPFDDSWCPDDQDDPFAIDDPEPPENAPEPSAGNAGIEEQGPAPEDRVTARSSPPDPATDEVLLALFNGLGADVSALSAKDKAEKAAEVGRTFRALAEAMRVMLATRREVKRALGVGGTVAQVGHNPLKFVQDGPAAVDGLLRPLATGFLHGETAVEDGLASMQAHQDALAEGILLAIRIALEAFDPDDLEARFEKRGLAAAVPAMRKAELWDRFVENYREVAEQADTDIRKLIGNELDRLYNS